MVEGAEHIAESLAPVFPEILLAQDESLGHPIAVSVLDNRNIIEQWLEQIGETLSNR